MTTPAGNRTATLLLFWCALLTATLYGDALFLPFFFDDYVHLPYVDAFSLPDMWRSAGDLAYYRPLSFTLWKSLALVFGEHNPVAHHAVNLLVHAVNGCLVALLAARLWPGEISPIRPLLAATLFLAFPFSYQAVPWAGALSHLLVTALVLAALYAYSHYRAGDGRRWLALSLLAAAIVPFAHENGALVGPLVAAAAFTGGRTPARALRDGLLWTVPALLWLPIWWTAPKAIAGEVTLATPETLLQNAAYFLQGIAYPLTWIGGALRDRFGANDLALALGLALAALLVAGLVQWRGGHGRRRLFPWLFIALAVAPAVLFLRFDYVINGPRLLMLAATGAAWLWSDVALAAHDRLRPRLATPLVALAFLLLLLQNGRFIRDRMALHNWLGDAYRQNNAALQVSDAAPVLINHPSWLAPSRTTYPLGHEGVLFWPDYAPPAALAALQSPPAAAPVFVRQDAIRPQLPFPYGLTGRAAWPDFTRDAFQFWLNAYAPEGVRLLNAGATRPAPAAEPTEWVARLLAPDSAETVAFLLASHEEPRGTLALVWQTAGSLSPDTTVFRHAVNAGGQLVAQADGDWLGGALPPAALPPSIIVEDRRPLLIPDDGQVLVGLYRRSDGARLTAVRPDGTPFANNAVPNN